MRPRIVHWPPDEDMRVELRVLAREGDVNAKAMLDADEKGVLPPPSAIEWYFEHVLTPDQKWVSGRPKGCCCPFGMIHSDCPHHGYLVP